MMTNKSNLLQNRLLLICACFIFTIHLSAQSSQNNKWQLLVEPYLMFPNMHGTTGIGNLPDAEVDENPSDIFKNLQIAAMLYAEAHKGGFTISSDLTYMKLGDDVVGKHGILTGDVNVKQLTWELAGLYKLRPWLNAGIGLQLNSIKSKANLTLNTSPTISSNSSSSETWLDPSIIAATKLPLSKNNKWFWQFRANLGGFGIGSDLYYQFQTYFGYAISRRCQASAGYRLVDIDYEKGNNNNRFLYNMKTFGPVLRFGIKF